MELFDYVVIGIFVVLLIGFLACFIAKIAKMSKEDRRELLKVYLKGLVAFAEKEIGSGNGEKKLEIVENRFKESAPFSYKIILKIVGKDNLRGLIEEALKEVKEAFVK